MKKLNKLQKDIAGILLKCIMELSRNVQSENTQNLG